SALIRAECPLDGHPLFAILFPLNFMQQFAQPLSSPVQLRLRDAFGASQHLRDLAMLVPLDIVQNKYLARAHRQLRNAASEIYSINRPLQAQVGRRNIKAPRGGVSVCRGARIAKDWG